MVTAIKPSASKKIRGAFIMSPSLRGYGNLYCLFLF
jgi:hypothetical protein